MASARAVRMADNELIGLRVVLCSLIHTANDRPARGPTGRGPGMQVRPVRWLWRQSEPACGIRAVAAASEKAFPGLGGGRVQAHISRDFNALRSTCRFLTRQKALSMVRAASRAGVPQSPPR